jgi:ABC-type phosphate transport system auxiliary subunit
LSTTAVELAGVLAFPTVSVAATVKVFVPAVRGLLAVCAALLKRYVWPPTVHELTHVASATAVALVVTLETSALTDATPLVSVASA